MNQRMESAPSSEEFQKEYIRHYLEASFEDKVPLDTLKTELSSIYSREILVSTSMYDGRIMSSNNILLNKYLIFRVQ